jgi:putrescine transport system ATP-binding protein
MNAGQLLQVGAPSEIYEAPKTSFVANFIGEVSFIEGRICSRTNNMVEIDYQGADAPLKTQVDSADFSEGQEVTFAIRPEKISVSFEPDDHRANRVKGKIVDIAYLGNVSTYHVRLTTGQSVTALMTNGVRVGKSEFTWEDEVWLNWTDSAGVVLPR